MDKKERFEEFEMHTHPHIEYICEECGTPMNEPHDLFLGTCDRCLNKTAE